MALFGRRKDKGGQPSTAEGGAGTGDPADVMAVVKRAQAQAIEQMKAFQDASSAGGPIGSNAWMRQFDGILSGAQSGYVKRCRCAVCGAPKKLASVTAYVYCDYCGSLVDFDLHRACEGSTLPGPEYRNLVNRVQPQIQVARAGGDRDALRELNKQIFASYVQNVPSAVSHRAKGDLVYRGQYVDYLAESEVIRAFDADATKLEQEMGQRVASLQWTTGPGGGLDRKVVSEPFWAMTDTLSRQLDVFSALAARTGVVDLDPDKASYLHAKIGWSGYCQGWLRYLSAEDAARLLDQTGLGNEYVPVQPEGAEAHNCGGCGGQIHALPGAKVVVCDGCGRSLDVGSAALTCPGCGGSVTLALGESNAACPFCQTNVARVGVL